MNRKQKIGALVLFFVMLINSFLELVGIAVVSPVVSVLQAQNLGTLEFFNIVNSNIFSRFVCNMFRIDVVPQNASKIITVMIIMIIALYIIKMLYSIFVTYVSIYFTRTLSRSIATKLINANLSMPYDYFINTNSAIIMRKCGYDVDSFTSSIKGVINTTVSILTSVSIFVYLMIISWQITLAFSACMVIAYIFSVYLLKNICRKLGLKAQRLSAKNTEILHKSIYGIKESKIAEKEKFFSEQYYLNRKESDDNIIKYTLASSLPSMIIQNLGIIIVMLATMTLVIILPNDRTTFIVTFLTAFVLATVKLIPNINVISANAIAFSYFKPSINTIFVDLKEASEIEAKKKKIINQYGLDNLVFNEKITITNLSFSYPKSSLILENVNLIINKGEYVAISGNSGAGKTTLIDNILGLLIPQKGDILCDNRSIYENIKSWHCMLSYVPQTIFLLDDTIRANVCFGLDDADINDEKVWEALEKSQLKEFVETLPDRLNARIGEAGVKLSGGQRQRIGIARAFYRDTPIMVLDEATSALDYKTEDNILLNIRKVKGDKTVIIITHRLNTISHCDKIFVIEDHACSQVK